MTKELPLEETIYKPTTKTGSIVQLQPPTKSKPWFLYFAAFTADLVAFTAGITFSWTSPVLPKLTGEIAPESNPLDTPATPVQVAWIVSFIALGSLLGPFLVVVLAEKLGRKRTLMAITVPMVISFLITAYAGSVYLFYIARFLMGLGASCVFVVLPIYLNEIAERHNRGSINCTMSVFVPSGILFSLALGPHFSIKIFSFLCLVPTAVFLPVFGVLIPESPVYIARSSNQAAVENSLMKLRQKPRAQIAEEATMILKEASGNLAHGGVKEIFSSRATTKAFTIVVTLLVVQQLCGIGAIVGYMHMIFKEAKSGLSPETCSNLVGVVQIIATITTTILVDKLGRKLLLLSSSFTCAVGLLAFTSYLYMKTHGYDMSQINWLPIAAIVLFMFAFNIGLGPLPWTLLAECFPQHLKAIVSSVGSTACFLASFFIMLFFPILQTMLGPTIVFGAFAGVTIFALVFVYIMLPETKNKSLEEIQRLLVGN